MLTWAGSILKGLDVFDFLASALISESSELAKFNAGPSGEPSCLQERAARKERAKVPSPLHESQLSAPGDLACHITQVEVKPPLEGSSPYLILAYGW